MQQGLLEGLSGGNAFRFIDIGRYPDVNKKNDATVYDLGKKVMNPEAKNVDIENYKRSIQGTFALFSEFGRKTELHASDWHVSNVMAQYIKDCERLRLVGFEKLEECEESLYKRVRMARTSSIMSMPTGALFLSKMQEAVATWWPAGPF